MLVKLCCVWLSKQSFCTEEHGDIIILSVDPGYSGRWVLQTCFKGFLSCKPVFSSHAIEQFSGAGYINSWGRRCCTLTSWFLVLQGLGERVRFVWHSLAIFCAPQPVLSHNSRRAARAGTGVWTAPKWANAPCRLQLRERGLSTGTHLPLLAADFQVFKLQGRKGGHYDAINKLAVSLCKCGHLVFTRMSLWLCCIAVVNRLWHLDGKLAT